MFVLSTGSKAGQLAPLTSRQLHRVHSSVVDSLSHYRIISLSHYQPITDPSLVALWTQIDGFLDCIPVIHLYYVVPGGGGGGGGGGSKITVCQYLIKKRLV